MMQLRKKQEKLAADHRAAKYRFILTELDLALTFCQVALTSDDKTKAKRNIENAEQAYASARHFLEDAGFSKNMKADVQERVGKLILMFEDWNAHQRRVVPIKAPRPQ